MENHQRSKKHKENLEALKAAMNAEDRAFFNSSTFDNEAEQQSECIRFLITHLNLEIVIPVVHITINKLMSLIQGNMKALLLNTLHIYSLYY